MSREGLSRAVLSPCSILLLSRHPSIPLMIGLLLSRSGLIWRPVATRAFVSKMAFERGRCFVSRATVVERFASQRRDLSLLPALLRGILLLSLILSRSCSCVSFPPLPFPLVAPLPSRLFLSPCAGLLNYKKSGEPFYNQLFITGLVDAVSGETKYLLGVQIEVKSEIQSPRAECASAILRRRLSTTLPGSPRRVGLAAEDLGSSQ